MQGYIWVRSGLFFYILASISLTSKWVYQWRHSEWRSQIPLVFDWLFFRNVYNLQQSQKFLEPFVWHRQFPKIFGNVWKIIFWILLICVVYIMKWTLPFDLKIWILFSHVENNIYHSRITFISLFHCVISSIIIIITITSCAIFWPAQWVINNCVP